MPQKEFDIQSYMAKGIVHIVSDSLAATAKNPKETAFMMSFAGAAQSASKKRQTAEKKRRAYPAVFDREHYKLLQSALRRVLFEGK